MVRDSSVSRSPNALRDRRASIDDSALRFHSRDENEERAPAVSAPGDFYAVDSRGRQVDLIGWVDREQSHCIWNKPPETQGELEQAFAAFDASEIGCYRYAGPDLAMWSDMDSTPARPRTFSLAAQRSDYSPPFAMTIDEPREWFRRRLIAVCVTVALFLAIWMFAR